MPGNDPSTPDVFSEGVENLFDESNADTVYEHHSENIRSQSARVLESDVIESEAPLESPIDNSKVRTRQPLSKKKKSLIYIGGGLFAFTAMVIVFQPEPTSGAMPVAPLEALSQNSSQIQSRFAPPVVPAPKPVAVAPVTTPKPVVVAPVPVTTPKPVVVAPVPVTPSFQAKSNGSKLAELERQIKELKSSMPPVVKKMPPSKRSGPLYLGDAVGVVKILEDGLVFRNASGKFTVVQLSEKYKRYGALISVNPKKASFVTTRGSWSVPE